MRNSIRNRCIRNYAVLLALVVSAIAFRTELLSAQGAVVGYVNPNGVNNPNYPSNEQLNRLTHIMVVDIGCNTNGTLKKGVNLPNNWSGTNGFTNSWLTGLVSRAHTKGIKVSICISGDTEFIGATSSTYINTFVSKIVDFVNDNGLDGVDIDWEKLGALTSTQWNNQYITLFTKLRANLPLCKRISVALPTAHPGYPQPGFYPDGIPAQIWGKVDAIHLMTYDNGPEGVLWPTHSHAGSANGHINNWASWGASQSPAITTIKKLHVGCAFFGWHPVVGKDNGGSKVFYKNYATQLCNNKGDDLTDVATKVNYCYGNNPNNSVFGGVMFWELSYDLTDATNPNSLLNAIGVTNNNNGGYFPPCTCPTALTYNTSPAILGLTTVRHEGNIIIQNVTVNNGVTLTVKSCINGNITVNNVTVVSGGKLILDAGNDVIINEIDVKLGAELEVL